MSAALPHSVGGAAGFSPRGHPKTISPAPAITVVSFCASLACGCAGGGHLELISLNYRAIDPPAPRASTLEVDRCYWWTDDAGRVWVALESVRHPWFTPFGPFLFQMSLALDRLPAGRARDYSVAQRELRALARLGPVESRFTAVAGVVAVYRATGDKLRGSFRLHVRREVSRLLGGWSEPTSFLMHGTFTALHDAARGRPIAEQTESHGWEREPTVEQTLSAPPAPGDE